MLMNKELLSKRFYQFALRECHDSSPLYEWLSLKISEDEEMLELSSHSREGQPVPNLFLGAIHYLLIKGADHSLKDFYPSIVENARFIEDTFPHFKDFCQDNREDIIFILKNKLVQTNEVRRCGYLYPTFSYIYNNTKKPLALIEIGTSAGFQLLWDKYAYSYNGKDFYGNNDSNLLIETEIKGDGIPDFLLKSPPVTHRVGLDLHINDVTDNEDALWLNALIWPEHKERRVLFEKATSCIKQYKSEMNLIEGDGVELLQQFASKVPPESTLCVFHTHVANQMPNEMKEKLLDQIKEIGGKRDIFHLYNNIWDGKLHLDSFCDGKEELRVIGETDGHGRWFTWEL
ncbi:DUF2332 domain-containing protein [Cytobacillus dafuensis]|nr:DUF2332 domain-containing protein [Cytobacillus dafuensis]